MNRPWIQYLQKSAASRDVTIFRKWSAGKITAGMAIKMMKISNNMPAYLNIEPSEWIEWVRGLGYRREAN